jgi:hypothetical protein
MSIGINNAFGVGSSWQVVKVGGERELSDSEKAVGIIHALMLRHGVSDSFVNPAKVYADIVIVTPKSAPSYSSNEAALERDIAAFISVVNHLEPDLLNETDRTFKIPLSKILEWESKYGIKPVHN